MVVLVGRGLIPGRHLRDEIQKTAIPRTAYILKKTTQAQNRPWTKWKAPGQILKHNN